jgi:hypothetical protein
LLYRQVQVHRGKSTKRHDGYSAATVTVTVAVAVMDPVQSDLNTQARGKVPKEVCRVLEEHADPLEVASAPRTRKRRKRTPLRSRCRRREEPSLRLRDICGLSSGVKAVAVAVEQGNEKGTKIGFATRRSR